MRTTLDIPDETFRKLKAEAALRGSKLKDLVTQFIENGLLAGSQQGAPVPRQRSPLPVVRPPTGIRHPALTNAQVEEIFTAEDHRAHP